MSDAVIGLVVPPCYRTGRQWRVRTWANVAVRSGRKSPAFKGSTNSAPPSAFGINAEFNGRRLDQRI
jgi:hypothetical protein